MKHMCMNIQKREEKREKKGKRTIEAFELKVTHGYQRKKKAMLNMYNPGMAKTFVLLSETKG